MAKISIQIPDSTVLFSCTIPVRISDVNYGNHVGNDSFVSIIHEARLQFLKAHSLSELSVGDNVGLIMGGLSVQFLKESFYGDVLEVAVYANDVSTVAFDLIYDVKRQNETICKGITSMVCYDYTSKKVKAIPEKLVDILKS